MNSRASSQIHVKSEHGSMRIRSENELWSPRSDLYQIWSFSIRNHSPHEMRDLRADLCQTWYVFNQDSIGNSTLELQTRSIQDMIVFHPRCHWKMRCRAPSQTKSISKMIYFQLSFNGKISPRVPSQIYIEYYRLQLGFALKVGVRVTTDIYIKSDHLSSNVQSENDLRRSEQDLHIKYDLFLIEIRLGMSSGTPSQIYIKPDCQLRVN